MFGVTRGKVIQRKHFLLALGLHNLTRSRKIIDIVNKLGHCISYSLTCEVETAQAESALKSSQDSSILPLMPSVYGETVFTHFWVDNFDLKIEKTSGSGSVNTTHLMAFQEISSQCTASGSNIISVPRRKTRKLFYEDINIPTKPVQKKVEPQRSIVESTTIQNEEFKKVFNKKFIVWLYIRKLNCFNQPVPEFKGWDLQFRQTGKIVKTKEVYLPPITTKVTDFGTIQKYLNYLQSLSHYVNMPYVNVTLDVGAAINAYKTIWSYPEDYRNVVIHLGSFHFLKENFQVAIP